MSPTFAACYLEVDKIGDFVRQEAAYRKTSCPTPKNEHA